MLGPPLRPLPSTTAPEVGGLVGGWWSAVASGRGTVVPDGAVDLLWCPGQAPFVAGPDIAPRPVELAAGTRLVGLRLRAGVAAAVLDDRVDAAVGVQVDLDRVWSRTELARLDEELASAPSTLPPPSVAGDAGIGPDVDPAAEAAAVVLARAVARRVPTGWAPDPLVTAAVAAIRSGRPVDPGSLSQRQVRRRFATAMGYGPTLYGRIVRLDRATDLLADEPDRSLADVALVAGYYDQAHLTRDCRQLLGTTPARLRPVG